MPDQHHAQVLSSPWQGVYGTHIDSTRHFRKHWHATYGVGVLEHGAQTSASGRGSVDAYAGDVITTNPGEVHDGRPLGGPSRRWRMLYLEPGVIASAVSDAACEVALAQPVVRDARVSQALRRLLQDIATWHARRSVQTVCDAEALACEASLVIACTLLLKRHAAHSTAGRAGDRSHAALARVHALLADDPLHAPSLAAMAAMAGLSKYQLLRRFASAYGLTPHAWLMQRRAEHARDQIRRGEGLVQAAASSGFADQSHMTRIFSRQFGFTPGAWQQAMGPRG